MSGLNQIKQELGLTAEMQDTTRGEEEICGAAHLICKADRTLTADCQQTERQGMKGKFQVIRMQTIPSDAILTHANSLAPAEPSPPTKTDSQYRRPNLRDVKAKTTMVDECGAALRVDREEQRNQLARQDASASVPLPTTMMRGRSPLGRCKGHRGFSLSFIPLSASPIAFLCKH
ncbi:hypothetical protein WR25_11690 [Diploscapter pachys]|uniref:Uncharacterized protein n=1 Tax=Diploscapter pachys TaxID=2018661 RepID=A0A2A2KP11_9BILA|nr:hypothetical protein WR25_11690 [Diploscapter pachys]